MCAAWSVPTLLLQPTGISLPSPAVVGQAAGALSRRELCTAPGMAGNSRNELAAAKHLYSPVVRDKLSRLFFLTRSVKRRSSEKHNKAFSGLAKGAQKSA